MEKLMDHPNRYGIVSRALHWGMAILFVAQFVSAAAHWALPREDSIRQLLWSYHSTLGTTLFLLVLLRGVWGLMNKPRRPSHSGRIGQAAAAGHVAIYVLMVIVPASRLLAAAGSDRGFGYLGIPIFPARETEIAWMQLPSELHGEMGWILGLLILGHAAMAIGWHHLIQRDGVLETMTGRGEA